MRKTETYDPLEDFQTKKEQVLYLLERYRAARDNDFFLQYQWLRIFGKVDLPPLKWEQVKALSGSMATLIRARQKLQNEKHQFEPSKDVANKRRRRAAIYQELIAPSR